MDQPTRPSKTIACLSAQIKIGGTLAYALFDSGSNTDAATPEYTKVVKGAQIALDEPVNLQLGCKGSQSQISYGTRVEVGFGGISGFHYFDQVNLDRYDVVIGTPFMNKHGVKLDFETREIRFPNGRVVKAMSSLEDSTLVAERRGPRAPRPTTKVLVPRD
ncbi:hypothetical protein FB45DRAFT_769535 [Roridomyces roridus]|uniref:Uncharacterized protein n=1 Tax=Roridomyces roridus TaxID=1738132 RepID=A0AAD7AYK0_9AGAR|nr:hypothetical protein FB45DRAFT_769535 [Roridomyces roridus]